MTDEAPFNCVKCGHRSHEGRCHSHRSYPWPALNLPTAPHACRIRPLQDGLVEIVERCPCEGEPK